VRFSWTDTLNGVGGRAVDDGWTLPGSFIFPSQCGSAGVEDEQADREQQREEERRKDWSDGNNEGDVEGIDGYISIYSNGGFWPRGLQVLGVEW
jgi:hypothetical protein